MDSFPWKGDGAHSEMVDKHTRKLLDGLQEHLHDTVAVFMCDHPDVPPALVGLTVGQLFLDHYRIAYPEDFACAARDTFTLLLKDADQDSRPN